MLATITQAPSIAIEQPEADRLAETFARVARWYDIPDVGEKAADHYAFIMAVGVIYGTRLVAAFRNRPRREPTPPAAVRQPAVTQPPSMSQAPQRGANGQIEPPDPRLGQRVHVEGLGDLDIPPLAGGPH